MALVSGKHSFVEPAVPPIRALSSLSRRDADAVRATVRAAGGLHTVEEHDDYDGYLSLLVTPRGEGGCYLVSGQARAVELSEVDGDAIVRLGQFSSVGAAMAVLRERLEHDGWR